VAIGDKRGEKQGERAVLIKQIKHMEVMNQKGELRNALKIFSPFGKVRQVGQVRPV